MQNEAWQYFPTIFFEAIMLDMSAFVVSYKILYYIGYVKESVAMYNVDFPEGQRLVENLHSL
ncbi:hypothetical protein ACERII_21180 [Evansella sp. AB-rgal1]|uniref:hypothetical protein n=1 Tax=Evansella sp. AB-rgal1 TaxID=3242696 RepID=UPI00359EF0BF